MAAASQPFSLFAFTLSLLSIASTVSSHDITQILSYFPEYTSFNSYLSQTNLSDEINSRTSITVLVLKNDAMSSLVGNNPLSVIKSSLSLHVLLHYYDPLKLETISNGSTLTPTLFQTTGNVSGISGFVNITDLKGGKVGFGSEDTGRIDATFTNSVILIPFDISVLQIDAPIIILS